VLFIGLIIITCVCAGPKIADALAYREVTRVRPAKTTMNAVSAISAFNLGKKTEGGTCGRDDYLHWWSPCLFSSLGVVENAVLLSLVA